MSFLLSQAALQKQQQQADLVQGTLDSNSFNSGEPTLASAAGPLCAASPPVGEEAPTVNGGQSDSYSEGMDREPEPEPAEEVSENGPLLGGWADVSVLKWNTNYVNWFHVDGISILLIVQQMATGQRGKEMGTLSNKQSFTLNLKPDSYLLCPCWCDLEGREEKSRNKCYMIVILPHILCTAE